jgi:hypothetical protein
MHTRTSTPEERPAPHPAHPGTHPGCRSQAVHIRVPARAMRIPEAIPGNTDTRQRTTRKTKPLGRFHYSLARDPHKSPQHTPTTTRPRASHTTPNPRKTPAERNQNPRLSSEDPHSATVNMHPAHPRRTPRPNPRPAPAKFPARP